MRSWLVILCVVTFTRVASADDSAKRIAATKTMFAAQRAALLKPNPTAFEATLTANAILAFGAFVRPAPLNTGTGFSVSAWTPTKIVVTSSAVGWSGTWGWVAAELTVTSPVDVDGPAELRYNNLETYVLHWVAFVVAEGDGVKTRALRVTRTRPDRDLYDGAESVQTLVPIAAPSPAVAILAKPATIAKQLVKDAAATIYGTSTADRGTGPAAKKLVQGWSTLGFEVVDTLETAEKASYKPLELTVGDATVVWVHLRMKLGPKKPWILLDCFAITRKVGDLVEIAALGFGA